ncbi:SAF domain-containing protein [Isoptericola sp. b441]|uniref:SAF domain-containing protein n=1 Tax=Actinotalea lenta TaxID=3064654 RepID=A0ABT9DCW0_9CELL|nr:SAF domain-containing protein [Isoptericola sp. b441]MDO8106767.1 SAF domain-containing protein [Isoptericola sp. b441]
MLLTLRIWWWRARPAVVAAGVLIAALATARVVTEPAPRVLAAGRPLAAGHVLAASDLRLRAVGDPPVGAGTDPEALVGHRLALAVPAGLPLVPELLADRFDVPVPDRAVVAPVALAEADVLRAGDHVDLLPAGCPQTTTRVAHRALVAERPDAGSRTVLLAVSPAEATTLTALRDVCSLAAVLVR